MSGLPRIPRGSYGFAFRPDAAPAMRVASGTRLVIETLDCFSNKITSASQVFRRDAELLDLIGAYNPISAPVYVEEARPGDTLAVHIERIRLGPVAPYAVTVIFEGAYPMCGRLCVDLGTEPATRITPIIGDRLHFTTGAGTLRLPVRPMVGTIGTAPADEESSSLEFGTRHGGNVDCPQITTGATVLLPVNVPGALLSLGDVHALMGDAEVTSTALETNADVTVRVEVIPGDTRPAGHPPRVDTSTFIGSLGCRFGATLEENLGAAFEDLGMRLRQEYGLSGLDAYALLGAVAQVQINQCVSGGWTAVLVRVARAVLPGRGREPVPAAGGFQ